MIDSQTEKDPYPLLSVWTGNALFSVIPFWLFTTLLTVAVNFWLQTISITVAIVSLLLSLAALLPAAYFAKNGRPKLGALIMSITLSISILRSLLVNGGLLLPIAYVFMNLIMLVGLIIGRKEVILTSIAVSIMFTLILWGQTTGLITERAFISREQAYMFLMVRLLITTAFIYYAAKAIEEAFLSVQERQKALEVRTAELTHLNEQLRRSEAINQQNQKEIEAALREKEVLLHEVHHRVKNNFQIVDSLLRMTGRKMSDPTSVQAELRDLGSRVRSMSDIHQQLYQERDFANLNFAIYAQKLITTISQTYVEPGKNIRFDLALAPVELQMDTAIPTSLILNELVTNAVKHAFPAAYLAQLENGGVITCTLVSQDDTATLTVANNGQPFDAEKLLAQETTGIQLLRLLTAQIKGKITAVSDPAVSHFAVTFPI